EVRKRACRRMKRTSESGHQPLTRYIGRKSNMAMPGFTAEAALFRSSRQYRRSPFLRGSAGGAVPQLQQNGTCMDWDCLSWCEGHSPFPETCYGGCQVPCDPNAPPVILKG